MMKRVCVAVAVVVSWAAFAGVCGGQRVELANENLAIVLDPADGYAVSGLANRAHDLDFIAPRPEGAEQDRSPWLIEIRDAGGRSWLLTAANAAGATHQLVNGTLTVTWQDVSAEECQADLSVTMSVRLPAGSRKSYWRIEVEGEAAGVVWRVDFPRVMGMQPAAEAQMCTPQYWGRLARLPARLERRVVLSYPQPASMQFLALWCTEDRREPPLPRTEEGAVETGWSPDRSDAAGLYWATEDGQAHFKRFGLDSREVPGQLSWWIENIPELERWPLKAVERPEPVRYSQPYDAVVAAFTGDYHEAAAMYREWAEGQVWCSRGPADAWPEGTPEAGSEELVRWVPPWFREVGFWAKFYHEPAKVVPEWAAYRKWLRVPMASHYYRYAIAAFNDNEPEQLPPDPYLLGGVRDARDLGVRPLPYILGTIWDTDTQSWIRENALAAAMKSEAGEIYPWVIGDETFAWMCPATEQWRAKMREVCEKLIWEHGVSGVYLDVLAAGGARPCYDPSHGHSVRGGNYQGQGNRKLMHDLRAQIRRLDPEASFFTEEIGELYVDVMDGYLTLDISRSAPGPGEQIAPIFTAVYHPYTINFGSDAALSLPPEFFAWQMAETLIWGSVPLNSTMVPPEPKAGDPNSEFLREVVQAYYVAGLPFLQGGEWRRIAVRPVGAAEGTCGLELAARPYELQYTLTRNRRRLWAGPAVMASAWERQGDLGIVMVNITEEEQPVELAVRGEELGLQAGARLVRTWPREPEVLGDAGGLHELTVPARSVAIYVITTDAARASLARELEETAWELLVVEDGEFPAIEGPEGSLWACSDGAVRNTFEAGRTVAQAVWMDETGHLAARSGRQAATRGREAEGHGLPRDLAEKPFLLLRRLPHSVVPETSEGVVVLSGDQDHLLCVAAAGTELRFAEPGLVAVSSGEIVRSIAEEPTDTLRLADDGEHLEYVVGYARIAAESRDEWLSAGDDTVRERHRALLDRLRALGEGPPAQPEAALAAATRALLELEASLHDLPAALSPVGPLMKLHDQLQALAQAQVCGLVEVRAEHRWLAAGVPKQLSVVVDSPAGVFDDLDSVQVVPVGAWAEGGVSVAALDNAQQTTDRARVFMPSVTLRDGAYLERMVPVLACARVESDGQEFYLTDVVHLEANRPFEIQGQPGPLTVVAGRTGLAEVRLRNWSPYELDVRLAGSGPDGWQVAPEPAEAHAPALENTEVKLAITPPAEAQRGPHEVRCSANHTEAADTEVVAFIKVNVVESLRPLVAQMEQWEPPDAAELPQLRRRGKFAIYAEAGERLGVALSNVRVTRYTDTMTFRLLDPDLAPMVEGRIPVDESREIDEAAEQSGTYYLEVEPGAGSARVQLENRPVAQIATREDPVHLYNSDITRYFHVPANSAGFRLGAQDGGPDETVRFVITSPTGRRAFEAEGNFAGAESEVQVRREEGGKVWTLRVEPAQDVSFWLGGDASPYLSTAEERVLIPEASR